MFSFAFWIGPCVQTHKTKGQSRPVEIKAENCGKNGDRGKEENLVIGMLPLR